MGNDVRIAEVANDHLDIVAMASRRWRAPDQDPDGRPAGPERLQQGASEEPVRAGDQYGRGRKRHMALPQLLQAGGVRRSEEHTSELQSLMRRPYAAFCLKQKNTN